MACSLIVCLNDFPLGDAFWKGCGGSELRIEGSRRVVWKVGLPEMNVGEESLRLVLF